MDLGAGRLREPPGLEEPNRLTNNHLQAIGWKLVKYRDVTSGPPPETSRPAFLELDRNEIAIVLLLSRCLQFGNLAVDQITVIQD